MGNVLISSSPVPSSFCFTSWSASWPELVALLSGQFNRSGTGINFGNATPALEDEDKPWFRTNSDGTPDKWYTHANGLWVSKHPIPPGAVWMYEGTEASIVTFDGGDGQALGPYSGQMWEKVDEMDARSPIGPGELPSGAVIQVGDNYGDEQHTNAIGELIAHSHPVIGSNEGGLSGDGGWVLGVGPDAAANQARNRPAATHRNGVTEDAGSGTPDPFSLVHPVRGIWFIRRTTRLYYVP